MIELFDVLSQLQANRQAAANAVLIYSVVAALGAVAFVAVMGSLFWPRQRRR